MTPIKRRVAAVSAPLLLALSLTACGGGPPDDASKEDFCEFVNFEPDLPENIADLSEDEQLGLVVDAFEEGLNKAEDTGTPEDIPEDAREGFEIIVDQADSLDEDELRDALENDEDPFADDVSDEDQEKVDSYNEWSSEFCA